MFLFLPPPLPPPPDGGGLTPAPERSRGGVVVLEGGSPDDFKRKTLVDMKLFDSGCLLYTEHSMPEKERNLLWLWCQERDKSVYCKI